VPVFCQALLHIRRTVGFDRVPQPAILDSKLSIRLKINLCKVFGLTLEFKQNYVSEKFLFETSSSGRPNLKDYRRILTLLTVLSSI
jgi:hypothetical protein